MRRRPAPQQCHETSWDVQDKKYFIVSQTTLSLPIGSYKYLYRDVQLRGTILALLRDSSGYPILFGEHQQEAGMFMSDQPDRILRLDTVLHRTGLSRSTLYRKVQAGTFPRQVKIAARCAGWRESSINDWMRNPMFWSVEDRSSP